MHFNRTISSSKPYNDNGCVVEYKCKDPKNQKNNDKNDFLASNEIKMKSYSHSNINYISDSSERKLRKDIADLMRNRSRPVSADSRIQTGFSSRSTHNSVFSSVSRNGRSGNNSNNNNNSTDILFGEDSGPGTGRSPFDREAEIEKEKEQIRRRALVMDAKSGQTSWMKARDSTTPSSPTTTTPTANDYYHSSQILGIHSRNTKDETLSYDNQFLDFFGIDGSDLTKRPDSPNYIMRSTYVPSDGGGQDLSRGGVGNNRPKTSSSMLARKVSQIRRDLKAMNLLSYNDNNINDDNYKNMEKKITKNHYDNKKVKVNKNNIKSDDFSTINKIIISQREMESIRF